MNLTKLYLIQFYIFINFVVINATVMLSHFLFLKIKKKNLWRYIAMHSNGYIYYWLEIFY